VLIVNPTVYRERLTVPWWAWPAAVVAAAFVVTELAIGAFALRKPIWYVLAAVIAVAALALLGRIRIRVYAEPAELHVDDARLPLSVVSGVESVEPAQLRNLLGREADPLAFVIARPWLKRAVRIDLDDPADPTPYWVVSTRHPDRLVAALSEGARVSRG
jgi:hypothetical protein